MIPARQVAAAIASRVVPRSELEHVRAIPFTDAGHGYDVFGLQPDHVALGLAITWPFYRWYFRVTSHGSEHVPRRGAAILAANHSGMLPLDAMMLWTDVLVRVGRVARPAADFFVQALPWIGTLFQRAGMVPGVKGNLNALLARGELAEIFPEGVTGIAKTFHQAYQLQTWRPGHAERAIRHRSPVVPVAIVGAEESWRQLTKLPRLGQLFGLPHIPIPLTPLPLPVRYHIYYGKPLFLHEGRRPRDADDPEVVQAASTRVRGVVEELITQGLQERKGMVL